jgi:hypothetical protein
MLLLQKKYVVQPCESTNPQEIPLPAWFLKSVVFTGFFPLLAQLNRRKLMGVGNKDTANPGNHFCVIFN